jgi:hypothetical protein
LKWHDITVKRWIEIQELICDELTSSELALELEHLFNEDFDDEISSDELRALRQKWEFIFHEPKKSRDSIEPKKSKDSIKHLPFNKMKTATYIDLDTYLTKYQLHEVIEKIIPLLFGEVEVKNITQVYYAIPLFLKYRKDIIEKYKGIFGGGEPDDDEFDDEEIEEVEVDNSAETKWGWLAVIYNMANGDITKTDAILEKSFISVLNWASMRKDFESRPPK